MTLDTLQTIQTPAYVADISAIKRNMEVVKRLKAESGCRVLLATKGFAMFSVFPHMIPALDGTTASGLFEARLGATHFGKAVHAYCPAWREQDLRDCLEYSDHIYFNSVEQLRRFKPLVKDKHPDGKVGLRVNPRLSLVKTSELYNPSSPCSRFGIQPEELTQDVVREVDILHFHNLCENLAADSVRLIAHISEKFGDALRAVPEVNIGGGHYITHKDYDLDALISALKKLSSDFDVQVTLEPGAAIVYDAGYLVCEVLDIIHNERDIAVLDTSASTHMPDILEAEWRPGIIGAGMPEEKAHSYILGGNTCMTGDVIGEYSFDAPLKVGQRLIFQDQMQYSFVKNTTFNGVPLPDLGILHEDGSYELVKRFGYEDFERRLS